MCSVNDTTDFKTKIQMLNVSRGFVFTLLFNLYPTDKQRVVLYTDVMQRSTEAVRDNRDQGGKLVTSLETAYAFFTIFLHVLRQIHRV